MSATAYPYGHPFWLGKPTRADLFSDWPLGLLDAFQSGHCFVNGIRGNDQPCHCDSYGTVLRYARVAEVMAILEAEFAITRDEWIAFADYWIDHVNRQPITALLGYEIRCKVGAPARSLGRSP